MQSGKKNVSFDYDGFGNRIAKHVYDDDWMLEKSTYYILDAQGNQLSMYEHEVDSNQVLYTLTERNIYGSSRLGRNSHKVDLFTSLDENPVNAVLGEKFYGLSNHLGNVLAVINDIKIPVASSTTVDYYEVGLVSVSDYSPFGVMLDGRSFSSEVYRYGFNGMEGDDEIKGSGNSYDFGARMYDSRVGRWLSRDKLEGKKTYLSPYQGFRNNPLMYVDPDGNDEYLSIVIKKEKTGKSRRIDVLSPNSARVMTDGLGSSNVHSNNYYDYRTVTTFTMHLDGSVSVSTSYEILYRNGLKDFDLSYGSSNVKPKGHIKDKADGWSWGQITEKIYRPGGLRLISNDAGGGTNVIALNDVKSIDVGLLLSALGGFSSGLKGGKAEGLERFKAIFDGVEKLFESAEGMRTGEGSTGTGEGNTETGFGEIRKVNSDSKYEFITNPNKPSDSIRIETLPSGEKDYRKPSTYSDGSRTWGIKTNEKGE